MATPRIKSTAVLIGYNADETCVYSEILSLSDYYDGEHVWDRAESIRKLKLLRIKGYLFDAKGAIDQEFDNRYDPSTGKLKSSVTRYADGTTITN